MYNYEIAKKKKGKKVQFYSKDRFLSWGKQHDGGEFEFRHDIKT